VPLSAAPTRRILRGSGIVDRRMPHGPPAMSRNQPSDAASSTSAAQADQPTIGSASSTSVVERANQPSDAASSTSAAQADQPTIGCRIVHQRCSSGPTNHRMPASSTSAAQANQPTIGCKHSPPASPKQIQIKSPRKRPAHSHRGGMGDSTLHSRNSLAFACRRLSANSVSLHARTVCSSLSQLQPARSCIPALGSERSFS